jgi:RecA/RadA recombinase
MPPKKKKAKENSEVDSVEVDSNQSKEMKKFVTTVRKKRDVTIRFGNEMLAPPIVGTGIRVLDAMLEHGGAPFGIILQIYGLESTLKTTLAYTIANSVLNSKHVIDRYDNKANCITVDIEGSYEPQWIKKCTGLNPYRVGLITSSNHEESFETASDSIVSGIIPVCVVDSVGAISPKDESQEVDLDNKRPAVAARILNSFLRICNAQLTDNREMILVLINQYYSNIGSDNKYKPYIAKGGLGLRYFNDLTIKLNGCGTDVTWLKQSSKKNDDEVEEADAETDGEEKEEKLESVYYADRSSSIRIDKARGNVGKRYIGEQRIYWKDGYGILKGADCLIAGTMLGVIKATTSWLYLDGKPISNNRRQLAYNLERYLSNDDILSEEDKALCKTVVDAVDAELNKRRSFTYRIDAAAKIDEIVDASEEEDLLDGGIDDEE